jgi:hypothetical protein
MDIIAVQSSQMLLSASASWAVMGSRIGLSVKSQVDCQLRSYRKGCDPNHLIQGTTGVTGPWPASKLSDLALGLELNSRGKLEVL